MRGSRTRDVVGVPRRVSALPLAVGADPESRLPVRAKMSRRPLGAKSSARRGSTRAVAIGWSSLTTRSASPEDCWPPTEDLQARPGVGERHVGRSRALRVEVAGSAASLPSPGQGPPRVPDRCGGHRRKLLVICLGAPPSRRPRRAGRRLPAHDRSRTRTSRLGASRGRVSAQGRALAAAATRRETHSAQRAANGSWPIVPRRSDPGRQGVPCGRPPAGLDDSCGDKKDVSSVLSSDTSLPREADVAAVAGRQADTCRGRRLG